jgi:hypothetical protein
VGGLTIRGGRRGVNGLVLDVTAKLQNDSMLAYLCLTHIRRGNRWWRNYYGVLLIGHRPARVFVISVVPTLTFHCGMRSGRPGSVLLNQTLIGWA